MCSSLPRDRVEGRASYEARRQETTAAPRVRPEVRIRCENYVVKNSVRGWRSGRLDCVLAGDFDLIGDAQPGLPAQVS